MRVFLVLTGAISCFIGIAASAAPTAYLHSQRLVAVQGARHLNLYCVGHGRPTVFFDSGLADSTAVWRLVQGNVAKTTRACAYDRAGYGFSDPPPGVSDAKAAVEDLHRLLVAAPISTPIIYVGHSIAGLYGVLLAANYPEDVAGEVLVDPSFANQFFIEAALLPPKSRAEFLAGLEINPAHLKKCAAMKDPLPKDCLGTDSHTGAGDTKLASLEKQHVSRPSYMLTNASEMESFIPDHGRKSLSQKELEAVRPNFGNKPLAILTHGEDDPNPHLTPSQNAAVQQAWRDGHDRLAALSTRGSNTVVPGSGHYIQMDRPKAVLKAILKVVEEVRSAQQ